MTEFNQKTTWTLFTPRLANTALSGSSLHFLPVALLEDAFVESWVVLVWGRVLDKESQKEACQSLVTVGASARFF